jgi:hypothetical protein
MTSALTVLLVQFENDPSREGIYRHRFKVSEEAESKSSKIRTLRDIKDFLYKTYGDIKNCEVEVRNKVSGSFERKGDDWIIDADSIYISVALIGENNFSNESSNTLAIKGREFDSSNIIIAETLIKIYEPIRGNGPYLGTGLNTWDCAVVLAKYLEKAPHVVHGKNVIEVTESLLLK